MALTVPASMGLLANDSDPDGDPLAWISYTIPANGAMTGLDASGQFTYTPDPGFSGLEQITYAISDGNGGIGFGELLILVVDDQNRTPVALPDVYTTPEGIALTVPAATGLLANDSDPDSDPLAWISYTVPANGTMTGLDASGQFTYTPNSGFSGLEQITYAISDGNGGIGFGELLIFVVDDQNRAPIAVPDVYTTPEGIALTVPAATGLLANDSDPDGDPLAWISYTVPANGTMTGLAASGQFTYTPNSGFSGLEQITYAISDGNGGIAFGELLIHVLPPPGGTSPVAISDVYTTPEGVALTVPASTGLLANDSDPDGDPLAWISYTIPANGAMTGLDASGQFTYTPDPGFSGLEQITYAVSDGNGNIAFGELLILVVDDQNRTPVALPDAYTTPEGVALTVPASTGLLANDFDLDGNPLAWISYTIPANGAMTGLDASGQFTYTPDPGFSGLEQITYAVSDGNGNIAFGELLILVVDDQNRPPIAVPDAYTTPEGVALTVPASTGLLANDFDPDGDPLAWISYTVPANGTMTGLDASGQFTYTPNSGFSGLEQITYAISDGQGNIAFGELLILVNDFLFPEDIIPPECGEIDLVFDGTTYEIVSSASDDVGIASIAFTILTSNLDGFVDDSGPQGPFVQGDVYTTSNPNPKSVGLRALVNTLSGRITFLATVSDAAGNSAVCDPVVTDLAGALPEATALLPSYPNPAVSTVTVPFTLAEAAEVRVVVYDVLGREVAVLADEAMDAGSYEVAWPEAASLPAGAYVVRMEAAAVRHTQRLTLIR